MKKNKKMMGIVFIILGLLLIMLINKTINNKMNSIVNNIEIKDFNCKIENNKDTHGGFLGDGDYFAKLSCSKLNYDKLSSNWKELPLTESLNKVMEIRECSDNGCKNVYEKYSIPNIQNGYYYFLDRHSESKSKYDDTDINNRSSYNFTLALLDRDRDTIYYYELDT